MIRNESAFVKETKTLLNSLVQQVLLLILGIKI